MEVLVQGCVCGLVCQKKGIYTFPETPIYKGVIEKAMSEISNFQKNVVSRQESRELEQKISESITFLKQNGYLVLKQM